MKGLCINILNNLMIGSAFTLSTFISLYSTIFGILAFVISYILLDLHSYIDKTFNYPNNLFIKKL